MLQMFGGMVLYLDSVKNSIISGQTSLGVEFGSTRIKAVLIGADYKVLASGEFSWENRLENGVWTYPLETVWHGLQESYAQLKAQVQSQYGVTLQTVGSIGFSAMMHGYLPFDKDGNQLAEFRTWRNTITEQAVAELTEAFAFNIPQRWSIAHLYQAILNKESHVKDISFLTTLAGYVHWQLTGEKVLGVGEASGMFPIDSSTGDYDCAMCAKFASLAATHGFETPIQKILPRVLQAGESAGVLTEAGARLIDPSGELSAGIPLCPPEGDAGTGMVATNSIAPQTGNVSAGTSIFAMAVLEKPLTGVYKEIDMVTTPDGAPVAMVHCNTCTSDLDAWVRLFSELLFASGNSMQKGALYDMLYNAALSADSECGDLLSYNYYSGEPVTDAADGRPLFVRTAESRLTLPNFMCNLIFSTLATLRIGMDILFEKEQITLTRLYGHGGLFKTPVVGQRLAAAALHTPVAVMETAGEGGAWGIALLAAYLREKSEGESLAQYLNSRVFAKDSGTCLEPDDADTARFEHFFARYKNGLPVEKLAAEVL